MFDDNKCGELQLERMIEFLKVIFEKFDQMDVYHEITFLCFARLYYRQFSSISDFYVKAVKERI